jgi:hypothetical protein
MYLYHQCTGDIISNPIKNYRKLEEPLKASADTEYIAAQSQSFQIDLLYLGYRQFVLIEGR